MADDDLQVHLFVTGVVQGVFFRANTQSHARTMKITGWVKNLPDGRVEILAQGNRENLNNFINWCNIGPSRATVDNVEIDWESVKDKFNHFEIRYY